MLTHEADSTNLLFRTLTEVRSSFSPPIPREDLYTLARKLTNAVEKLTSAAHVLSLHSIDARHAHHLNPGHHSASGGADRRRHPQAC